MTKKYIYKYYMNKIYNILLKYKISIKKSEMKIKKKNLQI
jgi:hypothetical protein